MSAAPTASASTKRARAETESHGSDNPSHPAGRAPSSPPSKPPPKRLKDVPSSPDDSPEEFAPDELTEDAEADTIDESGSAIERLERRINDVQAGKKTTSASNNLSASEKRARFAVRFEGKTPEEALGTCLV